MPSINKNVEDKEEFEHNKYKDISSCDRSTTSQFTTPGIHDGYEFIKEEIIILKDEIGESLGI